MSNNAVWSIILSALVLLWFFYNIIKTWSDDEKFRGKGIKLEAKIVDKKNVGVSGTGNIKFVVEVEFEAGHKLIRTKKKRFFTPDELVKIRNNTICLYYLPENPKQVYFVPGDME